ncbi:MAG TPA: histidine phosphatase family protein [Kouleothrix sp.]|uniref:histidine phosphatase family protein n=1 Tax=Kouleothrix sp. TaxID=2779161 RepID=UPI002BF56692|nr:histidine phosphatase family protein [Kouleothrix sp.]HRC74310.1 histidine phosphatase family protein [Kouleothrix sp.]
MNTIYLVRHGENTANLTREFSYRRVDYSLTPKGVLQAQQTGAFFVGKQIDAIYASPLKRAAETAAIIGAMIGIEPTTVEEFREVNVGALEDWPPTDESWAEHDRIVRSWFEGQPGLRFPGGENHHMLLARMRAGLAQALAGRENQRVIIVGHGGIFTFTIKDICRDIDLPALIRQPSRNCSITEIDMLQDGESWVGALRGWSSHAHISGDAVPQIVGHPAFDKR